MLCFVSLVQIVSGLLLNELADFPLLGPHVGVLDFRDSVEPFFDSPFVGVYQIMRVLLLGVQLLLQGCDLILLLFDSRVRRFFRLTEDCNICC